MVDTLGAKIVRSLVKPGSLVFLESCNVLRSALSTSAWQMNVRVSSSNDLAYVPHMTTGIVLSVHNAPGSDSFRDHYAEVRLLLPTLGKKCSVLVSTALHDYVAPDGRTPIYHEEKAKTRDLAKFRLSPDSLLLFTNCDDLVEVIGQT